MQLDGYAYAVGWTYICRWIYIRTYPVCSWTYSKYSLEMQTGPCVVPWGPVLVSKLQRRHHPLALSSVDVLLSSLPTSGEVGSQLSPAPFIAPYQ